MDPMETVRLQAPSRLRRRVNHDMSGGDVTSLERAYDDDVSEKDGPEHSDQTHSPATVRTDLIFEADMAKGNLASPVPLQSIFATTERLMSSTPDTLRSSLQSPRRSKELSKDLTPNTPWGSGVTLTDVWQVQCFDDLFREPPALPLLSVSAPPMRRISTPAPQSSGISSSFRHRKQQPTWRELDASRRGAFASRQPSIANHRIVAGCPTPPKLAPREGHSGALIANLSALSPPTASANVPRGFAGW
jgi:hypothetical protein